MGGKLSSLGLLRGPPGTIGPTGATGAAGPTGDSGNAEAAGLLTYSTASLSMNQVGATMVSGNYGVGCGFVILPGASSIKITGVKFWWGAYAATVRTSIWEDDGAGTGARLATVDKEITAVAGIYTSVFASPYVVPVNKYGRWMTVFVWDTAGLYYPKVNSFVQTFIPTSTPLLGGSRIVWLHFGRFATADGPPTSGEGPLYAVEPVLALV